VRIAFYAPMKPPDHPTPSGDRRMARALLGALAAGHDVAVATRLRAFDGAGDAEVQAAIRVRAERVADRLIARWRHSRRPDLWFTYHVHHKAPDWIGPRVAGALGIPYVIAEASHAPKRRAGPWAIGYQGALAAIRAADAVLVMSDDDMPGIRGIVPARRIVRLPPFLDPRPFARAGGRRARLAWRHGLDARVPWPLTVAMMRPGDKTRSYQRLGRALGLVRDVPWQLIVVGDGAAAAACSRALGPLGARVRWAGALRPTSLPAYYASADVFVWPGVGEAYGMAYLEAQAAGLPVIAGAEPGVRTVVRDGSSGILVPPGDDVAFAAAVRRLLVDADTRHALGRRAKSWVARRHGPDAAHRALERAIAIAVR